jgi:P pilus assembly chaperone PapD
LSELVVELGTAPNDQVGEDVEIWNNGSETSYVSVTPREILAPGTAHESSVDTSDPDKLGLLVAPARLVLEPGQRRILRFARLQPAGERERIYRVTVKPVVSQVLPPEGGGLKLLVGYDVLVLARPREIQVKVVGERSGDQLILKNEGNVSVELVDGKQCATPTNCESLAGIRLYAGAQAVVDVPRGHAVEYKLKAGPKTLIAAY